MKKLALLGLLVSVMSIQVGAQDPRAERKAQWDGGARESYNQRQVNNERRYEIRQKDPNKYERKRYRPKHQRPNYNVNINYNNGYYNRPRYDYYNDPAYYSCRYRPDCGYNKPYTIYGSAYYNSNGYSGGNLQIQYNGSYGGYSRYEMYIRD